MCQHGGMTDSRLERWDPEERMHGQVSTFVSGVLSRVRSVALRGDNYMLDEYPQDSCLAVSYALGHLLYEYGYGTWLQVEGVNVVGDKHSWLELHDRDSTVRLVVDATVHQFEGFDGPLIGPETLEVHETYFNQRRVRLMPWAEAELAHELFAKTLDDVRAVIAAEDV